MNQSIAQVALVVRDYDEAITFFTEVLGFDAMKRLCAMCCDDPTCSEHALAEQRRASALPKQV